MQLTILSTNWHTESLLLNLIDSLYKFTSCEWKMLVAGNELDNFTKNRLKMCDKVEYFVSGEDINKLTGSEAHGARLDFLISKVETPYFAIIDSDVCIMMRDWDTRMIDLLGEDYTLIDGRVPSFGFVNTEEFRKLGSPSCRPLLDTDDKGIPLKDSAYKVVPRQHDTCWRWDKLRWYHLEVRNTRNNKDTFFNNILGIEEYYIKGDLVAAHFGRGAYKGISKPRGWWIDNIPFIGRLAKIILGQRDYVRWLDVCQHYLNAHLEIKDFR